MSLFQVVLGGRTIKDLQNRIAMVHVNPKLRSYYTSVFVQRVFHFIWGQA